MVSSLWTLPRVVFLNEEMRRKSLGTSPNLDILVSEYRGRSNSRAPERDQSRSNSKGRYKDVECNYCHKKGNIKKYCWKLKNKTEKDNSDKGKDSSDDEDRINATSADFLLVQEFEPANLVDSSTSWVIDSGASFHITSRRDLFTSYTPSDFGNVKMAHESVARCIGVGHVCLEMSNGSRLILKHVKHVPDVRLNLLLLVSCVMKIITAHLQVIVGSSLRVPWLWVEVLSTLHFT